MSTKRLTKTMPKAPDTTATEKALAAIQDLESIRQAAIDEQLKIIEEAQAVLSKLGYGEAKAPKPPKVSATGEKRQRAPKKCSHCGEEGHTKLTCPKLAAPVIAKLTGEAAKV